MTEERRFDIDLVAISNLRELSPPKVFEELIDLYLSDSRRRLADIQNAVTVNDLKALSEAAHGLKGSSVSIGVSSVAKIAAQLERAARAGEESGIEALVFKVEQRFLGIVEVLKAIRDGE